MDHKQRVKNLRQEISSLHDKIRFLGNENQRLKEQKELAAARISFLEEKLKKDSAR